MRSTLRPPPLNLYPRNETVSVLLSPELDSFLPKSTLFRDNTPSTPRIRRHRLLVPRVSQSLLSPVRETDENRNAGPSITMAKPAVNKADEEVDVFDDEEAQVFEVVRENISVVHASPVSQRLPLSPSTPVSPIPNDVQHIHDAPSHEEEAGSLSRLLKDFPLPPTTIRPAPKDLFLSPRRAPRPPQRVSSAPKSLTIRPPPLGPLPPVPTALPVRRRRQLSYDRIGLRSSSEPESLHDTPSPTSSDEEFLRNISLSSRSPTTPSPWRETIDSIFDKPPVPPRPARPTVSPRSPWPTSPVLSGAAALSPPRSILKNRQSTIPPPMPPSISPRLLSSLTPSTSFSTISPPPSPFPSDYERDRQPRKVKPPTPPKSHLDFELVPLPTLSPKTPLTPISPPPPPPSLPPSRSGSRSRSDSDSGSRSESGSGGSSASVGSLNSAVSYTTRRTSPSTSAFAMEPSCSPRSSMSSIHGEFLSSSVSSSSSSSSGSSTSGRSRRTRHRSGSTSGSDGGSKSIPVRGSIPVELFIRS